MCDRAIRSHMGLHYTKVDAALTGKIDPTTVQPVYYTFSTEDRAKVFQ